MLKKKEYWKVKKKNARKREERLYNRKEENKNVLMQKTKRTK